MILLALLLAQPDCFRHPEGSDCKAYRAQLCRTETIAAKEGLIGTAPLPGEEGIGESNPTPMCRTIPPRKDADDA